MTFLNFVQPILPEISLFSGALLILILDLYLGKNKKGFFRVSYLLAIFFAILSIHFVTETSFHSLKFFNNMFVNSTFTLLVKFMSLILLIFVLILSLNFLKEKREISAEIVALMMISVVGSMLFISANDFLTFYLALELQSLPLYLLAALNRKSKESSESAMKYFILGSVASGLLLLGISIFYGFFGTTNFDAAHQLFLQTNQVPPAALLGFILILVALFFKISAAPFHMWTPDVYQGSPTAVTAFFATAAKLASVLVFVRIFLDLNTGWVGINKVLLLVAFASLAVGSFGAIKQSNIKRLLAYSSIGHIGFVILGLSAISLSGIKACAIYMIIYSFISVGNFGFLCLIQKFGNKKAESGNDASKIFEISNFSGLAKQKPILATIFAILMLSSAGIPPLAGFFAKFYVVMAAVKARYFIAATFAIIFSVVSAFYYLKIIKTMFFDEPKKDSFKFYGRLSAKMVVGFMAAFNLFFIFLLQYFLPLVSSMVGF